MIRLHYNNQTNKILGAYPDNENAPTPNITVADDAWMEYDTVEGGELVHNVPPPQSIQDQIDALEAQVTNRRLREGLLNKGQGMQFVQDIDDQIEALRASA
ncbi:MAG: hypothetical protein KAS32_20305 [Candidatus Peribacteraceae bacterium]|nr:hypothetical protein [Candidatus Peribacteraceae bacterium]